MGQMADIRLGDLGTALGRYRPVLATVGIITVVALALPGGATTAGAGDEPFDPGFDSRTTPTAPVVATEAPVFPAPTGGLTAAAPLFDVAPSSPAGFPTPSGAFGRTTGTGSFTPPSPAPTSDSAPAGAAGSSPGGDGGSLGLQPQAPIAAPSALRITESLWATLGAGTPVGTAGVPEASLPVANRLGGTDKASYVRLQGTDTTLVLTEAAEGQRQAAGAVVEACAVTDPSWEAGEAAPFDDAPAFDAEACASGVRADDGTWSFDLSALGDPATVTGFALVPGPDAPVDFQVAFSAAG